MKKIDPTPSEEKIRDAVDKRKNRAEEYLRDADKSRNLLETAVKKAYQYEDGSEQPPDFWHRLKALFRLFRAYTKKEYTTIPWGSLVMVTVAIIYFISPIDLILDWLPLAGFIDDAAVVVFVIRQIRIDLDRFLEWERRKDPSKQVIDL